MRLLNLIYALVAFVLLSTTALIADDKEGLEAMKLMAQGKTDEAIAIFEKLAEKGDDKAMVQLGNFYFEGQGVKQDYSKAMDWWLKALKSNPDAYVNLGVLHRDGKGVPKNKKIAYCVFVSAHMLGLGSDATTARANRNLRKLLPEISDEEVKDCLSNYTMRYVLTYLESKGKLEGIPDDCKPSVDQPAFRDTGWWTDEELDRIYGPPTEEEIKRRKIRDERRAAQRKSQYKTIVYQFRFSTGTEAAFKSYEFIEQIGMGKGSLSRKKVTEEGGFKIYELSQVIGPSSVRYANLENEKMEALVYKIDHPTQPKLSDWSKWQKPEFVLKESAETFFLVGGGKLPSKSTTLPENPPEFRFKIIETPTATPPNKPKPE